MCWWCVWVPVLAFLGLVWRLCVGVGPVCRGPSPVSAVWFPAPPGWGLLVVCPPFSASLGAVFPWCRARAFPAVVGGWGVLVVGSGPFPWCFPLGGAMLALPVRV